MIAIFKINDRDVTGLLKQKSKTKSVYGDLQIIPIFANQNGSLAEWLGNGLQHHLQRFESARNLTESKFLIFRNLLFRFIIFSQF